MRKLTCLGLILFISIASKAQQPVIDSVKLLSMEKEAKNSANSGDYDHAATLAKQIIAMGVHDSSAYYLTALVLTMDGKKDEGKLYYDTALAKGYDPNTDAANMLGLNKPSSASNLNLDSAFAAVHADAVEKSKHLPKGAKNAKLYQIYVEDQAERSLLIHIGIAKAMSSGFALRMATNDIARRKELYAMMPKLKKTGGAKDLQEAGLILQHGNDTTDYWNAHELAMRAVKMGDTDASWLAAATLDRYLVTQRKPQKYGTQSFQNKETGKYELYPVDPATTDEERAKWHVPSLAEEVKQTNAIYGNGSSDSTH
jgi:hypothetical protein